MQAVGRDQLERQRDRAAAVDLAHGRDHVDVGRVAGAGRHGERLRRPSCPWLRLRRLRPPAPSALARWLAVGARLWAVLGGAAAAVVACGSPPRTRSAACRCPNTRARATHQHQRAPDPVDPGRERSPGSVMDDMALTLCSGPPRIAEARPDSVRCDERPARTRAPAGTTSTPATCPGAPPRRPRGGCWSASSCSSRRRSPACCPVWTRLAGGVADPGRPGRRAGRRGGPGVGPARLPAPGAAPARGRAGDRGAARRPGARVVRRAAGAARGRRLHRRRGRVVRLPAARTSCSTPTCGGCSRGRVRRSSSRRPP